MSDDMKMNDHILQAECDTLAKEIFDEVMADAALNDLINAFEEAAA